MSSRISDKKSRISFALLDLLCRAVVANKFPKAQLIGLDNIPASGPFLLIANHSSRWDPLVVHTVLRRPANYLTSPNELKGLQGTVLKSVGAFPARGIAELTEFIVNQASKGEPVVIFPEGNVFRDQHLHPFKKGTAHFIVACAERSITLPVIPVAIEYQADGVSVVVSRPLVLTENEFVSDTEKQSTVKAITEELYERLNACKYALGLWSACPMSVA